MNHSPDTPPNRLLEGHAGVTVITGKPQAVSDQTQFRSGMALAVAGTFLFALKSIFIKLAFAAGADATTLLMFRMTYALPFYAAVLWKLRRTAAPTPTGPFDWFQSLTLGFLGYYLASYLDLSGLQYVSAQMERLTLFTYPTMVAFLAWMFLGEKIDRRIIAAIILSYLGVALMYSQERSLTEGSQVGLGIALVFGAAISYSVYILFAKPTMQRIGSRQFTSLAMIGSTFFVGVHFFITHSLSDLLDADPMVHVYGIVLAFVCTVLPSFMINEAILRIGATRTTVVGSVGPVLTMGLAILVLAEPTSISHIAGMGIAILGVSLVAKK